MNSRYACFPLQEVESQVHPKFEFWDNYFLLMEPVMIHNSNQEACLIESSVNSVQMGTEKTEEEKILRYDRVMDKQCKMMQHERRPVLEEDAMGKQVSDLASLVKATTPDERVPGGTVSYVYVERNLIHLLSDNMVFIKRMSCVADAKPRVADFHVALAKYIKRMLKSDIVKYNHQLVSKVRDTQIIFSFIFEACIIDTNNAFSTGVAAT